MSEKLAPTIRRSSKKRPLLDLLETTALSFAGIQAWVFSAIWFLWYLCYMLCYSRSRGISHSFHCMLVSVVCVPSASFLISKTNIAAVVTRNLVLFREIIKQNVTDAHCWNNLDDSIDSGIIRKVMFFWGVNRSFFKFKDWLEGMRCELHVLTAYLKVFSYYLSTLDVFYREIGRKNSKLVCTKLFKKDSV